MMFLRLYFQAITAFVLLILTQPSYAQEVVCMKKTLKVRNGKVSFGRAFSTRNGSCLKREFQVTDRETAATILEKLKTVDGSGSILDADLLDGIDASSFATAQGLTTVENRVSSTESDITELEGLVSDNSSSISGHTTSITNNASAISTLNTDLGNAEQAISNLKAGANRVRVGKTDAQYTSLEDAVAFVNTQSRSSSSPWLIEVGPGTYSPTSRITVPTYTTIRGAGKLLTIVSRNGSSGTSEIAGVFSMSEGAGLEDLKIEVLAGAGSYSTGVYLGNLNALDPTKVTGIHVRLKNLYIKNKTGASYIAGIYLKNSHAVLDGIEIVVGDSAVAARALHIIEASNVYLSDSVLDAEDDGGGCSNACQPILSYSTGTLDIQTSRITAGGTSAVYLNAATTLTFRSSYSDSAASAISASDAGSTAIISNSVVDGVTGAGTKTCAYVSRVNGTVLDATCN